MKISAGILLESCGVFLLAHPTEVYGTPNKWTIPKGEANAGELFRDTALREFVEETGLDLTTVKLLWPANDKPTGTFKVGKDKLVVYYHVKDTSKDQDLFDYPFVCHSVFHPFEDRPDFVQPELDKFTWADKELARDMVFNSQKQLFC